MTGREVFNWDSGPCTMLEKLTALGKTVNLTDVEALLQRVKDEMRRMLTDRRSAGGPSRCPCRGACRGGWTPPSVRLAAQRSDHGLS